MCSGCEGTDLSARGGRHGDALSVDALRRLQMQSEKLKSRFMEQGRVR